MFLAQKMCQNGTKNVSRNTCFCAKMAQKHVFSLCVNAPLEILPASENLHLIIIRFAEIGVFPWNLEEKK